jgi:hypothetical protein
MGGLHLGYNDNRWLQFGERTVELDLEGGALECFAGPLLPIGVDPISWVVPYPTRETAENAIHPPGHLIGPVAAGSTVIRLVEPAAPGEFRPGDALLICGDVQQVNEDGTRGWGWPPNCRAIDWRRVAVVDGQTIQLTEPLEFDYDGAWPDYPHGINARDVPFGRPRVFNARYGEQQMTRSLTIRNGRLVRGRFAPAQHDVALALRALHIRLEDCEIGEGVHAFPTVAAAVEIARTTLATLEWDKLVGRALLQDCEVVGTVSGGSAGCLDVTLAGTRIGGQLAGIYRRLTLAEVTVERGMFISTAGPLDRVLPLTVSGTVSYP